MEKINILVLYSVFSIFFTIGIAVKSNTSLLTLNLRQFINSKALAQVELPDVESELPDVEDAEEIIDEPQQILDDFEYQDSDYWQSLCDLFNQTGQVEKAQEACRKIIELGTDEEPDVWLARGNSLFQSGEYVEAIASYNEAVEIEENYSLALTYRCASYFQLALYEEAIADCEAALEKDGDWKNGSPVLAWYFKGLALSRLERPEAALINYERAIAHSPESDLVHAERCRTLLTLSKQQEIEPCIEDKAIARYERTLIENPNDVIVLTNQGLFFEALGREYQAFDSYNRALEILPQSPFIAARRCAVASELGNYEEALASCNLALESDRVVNSSELALIWTQRSRALIGLEQYEEASNSATKAIAINQGVAEAWNNQGISLWYLGRPEEALIAIERAIDIEPEYTRALFNYGRILSSIEQYEEALNFYDRALETSIDKMNEIEVADIWVNRSVALFNLDRCRDAFESTKEAIALDPDSFEGWYNQGVTLSCLGENRLALEAYERADELNPENPIIYTGRAVALENLGLYQEALAIVEAALELDDSYEPALNSRDRLISLINRTNFSNESNL